MRRRFSSLIKFDISATDKHDFIGITTARAGALGIGTNIGDGTAA